ADDRPGQRPGEQTDRHHHQWRHVCVDAEDRHLRDDRLLDDDGNDHEQRHARGELARPHLDHRVLASSPVAWGLVRIWTEVKRRIEASGVTGTSPELIRSFWLNAPTRPIGIAAGYREPDRLVSA